MAHTYTEDGYSVKLYSGDVYVGGDVGFATLDEVYNFTLSNDFADYARVTGPNGFDARIRFNPVEEC